MEGLVPKAERALMAGSEISAQRSAGPFRVGQKMRVMESLAPAARRTSSTRLRAPCGWCVGDNFITDQLFQNMAGSNRLKERWANHGGHRKTRAGADRNPLFSRPNWRRPVLRCEDCLWGKLPGNLPRRGPQNPLVLLVTQSPRESPVANAFPAPNISNCFTNQFRARRFLSSGMKSGGACPGWPQNHKNGNADRRVGKTEFHRRQFPVRPTMSGRIYI